MLSGIKFIPRDQLEAHESEEERKNSTKKERRDGKKVKDKRSRKREYSSDSDIGSDFSDSESEDERSKKKKKRKGRKKVGTLENSSGSEDYLKKRRGKKKDKKESLDDDDWAISQSEKELARKEMGLEWMLGSGRSLTTNAVKNDSKQEELLIEEVKKTNPRELNLYLKDNGSGYPDDASPAVAGAGQMLSSSVVGDGGASWRLKALKRAKEQAAREGRKLDEVVDERWGSLSQLAASVSAQRAAPCHAHLHAIKDRKKGHLENSGSAAGGEMTGDTKEAQHAPPKYLRDVSSQRLEMRKPKQDSLNWKKNRKPNISQEDSLLISAAISGINKFTDDGSFMESIACLPNKDTNVCNSSDARKEENDVRRIDMGPSSARNTDEARLVNKQGLSANQLAAKVLQLRMKGRHEEAEQLSKEMEAMIDKPDKDNKMSGQETERNTRRYIEKQISSKQKKQEQDADLHLAQTIMRNKQYSMTARADDEYDYDGDIPSKKHTRKKEGMHERRNIPARILTQQERCQFCFENPSRPKHLVVAIGNFTYLMLPQWQPVVHGHCCILPMQHDASTRVADKNVSEELRNFKKCLLRMFAAQDKDVVFTETVIGLSKQRRHCLIECIPVPYAIAKQAPMYFKKAIDEAEDEWGQHEMKKVIPTSGNLRNVIPDNFAYFHVEFGLDKGFVHVIDDDSNFPSSFGLNVIRGMLRLPEEDMHRRRQHEPVEKQKQDVARFAKDWEPFDWTKDLG